MNQALLSLSIATTSACCVAARPWGCLQLNCLHKSYPSAINTGLHFKGDRGKVWGNPSSKASHQCVKLNVFIMQGGLLVDGVLASCNVAAASASDADFAAALAPVRAAYAQVCPASA